MMPFNDREINPETNRFPFCVVWTPIPCLTWFFPFIGHMGIANSRGIIRDFAGSYYVAEDEMGFGWPTRYWQLRPEDADGGHDAFDRAVQEASDEYKTRTHNLICDNCHSHVALAMNKMRYQDREDWNMFNLAWYSLTKGNFVRNTDIFAQYLPFAIIAFIFVVVFAFL